MTTVQQAMLTMGLMAALAGMVRAQEVAATPMLEMEKLRVQRKEVFEFTEKPTVTRAGDTITIAFAVKDFCDVTVAIEDDQGRIVRHLASGVLGKNAPAPFQPNSLEQTLVWDGKNDKEEYVDDKDRVSVRVSLGLKAQFERTLLWSPYRRWTRDNTMISPAKEGVYVHDIDRHVLLFDHEGNYLRTVYPFPADKIQQVQGLDWAVFPPGGERQPVKRGVVRNTFLTFADFDFGTGNPRTGIGFGTLAARDGRVYLSNARLNRLTDYGGLPLQGPQTSVDQVYRTTTRSIGPMSSAISPDGKSLYLAGYLWWGNWFYHRDHGGLHGVTRLDLTGTEPAQPFLGKMFEAGSGNDRFTFAAAVACDARGRIYVADYVNDRIQIFDPAGHHLKTLPATKPTQVCIHPSSGEIYVFSWIITTKEMHAYATKWLAEKRQLLAVPPSVTRYGPFEKPEKLGAWTLPLRCYKAQPALVYYPHSFDYRVALDGWTDPPTLWLVPGRVHPGNYCETVTWETGAIKILAFQDRKLVVKRDFGAEAAKTIPGGRPPHHHSQRLYFNPADGSLYIGQRTPSVIVVKAINSPLRVDPRTGKAEDVRWPMDPEDMAFDMDGLAYMRTADGIARFDSRTWREVPFDYGEERPITYQHFKTHKAVSAISFPGGGNASSQLGGIGVSPRGHVVVHVCNPNPPNMKPVNLRERNIYNTAGKRYEVRIFPGRAASTLVHVFDKYGKPKYDDALPGVGYAQGIAMDKDDNLYLMATTAGNLDGKPYPDRAACTLIKVRPKTKIYSDAGVIPLTPATQPKGEPDVLGWRDAGGKTWFEKVEWTFPGVGIDTQGPGRGACHCAGHSRFALDYFGRSFAPEIFRHNVVAIDTAGNAIVRIGRYGTVDDGVPLIKDGGPPNPRSIGGDEVSLFSPRFVATDTDRRLFVADPDIGRILSIKLGYHAEEIVKLKDVADTAKP